MGGCAHAYVCGRGLLSGRHGRRYTRRVLDLLLTRTHLSANNDLLIRYATGNSCALPCVEEDPDWNPAAGPTSCDLLRQGICGTSTSVYPEVGGRMGWLVGCLGMAAVAGGAWAAGSPAHSRKQGASCAHMMAVGI